MTEDKQPTVEKANQKPKTSDFYAVAAKGCFVYAYLRSKTSEIGKAKSPYYVGIASQAKRPLDPNHSVPIPPCKSNIVILKSGLTAENARAYEQFFIARFGRIDLGTGYLRNRTPGGESWANSPEVIRKRTASRVKTFLKAEKQQACLLGITVPELRDAKKKKHQDASSKRREHERKSLNMTCRGHSLWVQNGKPSEDLGSYQEVLEPNHAKDEDHKELLSAAATKFYERQALEQGFESLEARKKHHAKMKRERLMKAAHALGMTKRQYQSHQKALKAAKNA